MITTLQKKFNQYLISVYQCYVFNSSISRSSISNTAKAEGCHKDNMDGFTYLWYDRDIQHINCIVFRRFQQLPELQPPASTLYEEEDYYAFVNVTSCMLHLSLHYTNNNLLLHSEMGIYEENMQKESIYENGDSICMHICWRLDTFVQ